MDAISAGRLDEDDDQLDGVDADLSVGDSTMTLDVEEAELTPPPQAVPVAPPRRAAMGPVVPPPPAAPPRAIAIPVLTVPSKSTIAPPSIPKAPPPVPRSSSPAIARVPTGPTQTPDRGDASGPTRSTATIPPPMRRRPTMSQPAIAIPVADLQPAAPVVPVDAPAIDDNDDGADEFVAIDSQIDLVPAETATAEPEAAPELSLEAQLDAPSVLDMALAELNEQGLEARAALFEQQVTAEAEGPKADVTNAAALSYELGHWYQHILEDEARAVKAYGRALALDPSLRPNLWAIRSIFYRRQLWPNLLKLIDAELGYAKDDRERADLHVEQADVLLRGASPDGAAEAVAQARNALESALLYDGKHLAALLMLERIVSAHFEPANVDEAERLASLHTTIAELATLPERQQASWLRVAELCAANDPLRAADALERATSLVANCGNADAVAQCAVAVAARRTDADGNEAMLGALQQYVGALEARVSNVTVEPDAEANPRETMLRREVAAVYRRIAQLSRTVDASNAEAAWQNLQRGLAHVPGDALLTADLTELAEELGKYDELATLVETATANEADPARLLALGLRRADALLRGGRQADAATAIGQLQASDPGSLAVASLLERAAIANGDRAELARAWRVMAEAFELGTWGTGITSGGKNAHAAAMAYLAAAQATDDGQTEDTRNLISKARELAPAANEVWQATLDDLERNGAHRAAVALLGFAEPGHVGTAPAATVPWSPEERYRRAMLIAVAQGDGALAMAIEKQWAAAHPDDVDARWRLDALAVSIGADAERGPALLALAALEPSAELQGIAFGEAARAFERTAWQTTDAAQADAWQRGIAAYREAAVRLPDDAAIASGLLAALRATRDRAALAELQLAQARRLPDGAPAHAAYREAILLADEPLAIAREWLARFPSHVPAQVEVARYAAATNDWASAATAWRTAQQSGGDSGSAIASILYADASERSDAPADALEGYAAALAAIAPQDTEARAYVALAAGDYESSSESINALIEAAGSSRFAAELAEHAGWQVLVAGDPAQAGQQFAQAERVDVGRTGPLLGLALVAATDRNPERVAHWLQKFARNAADPAVASALFVRAATAQFVAGDASAAYGLAAEARACYGEDRLAVELAAQLAQRSAGDPLAASALYEAAAAGAKLADSRLHWQLEQIDALLDAGQLRRAATVLAAVNQQAPTHIRVLRTNLRLAQAAGRPRLVAGIHVSLGKQLGDATNQLVEFRAAVAIANGADASVHDRELAIVALQRILEIEPGADEFFALRALLQEAADAARLDRALARRIAHQVGQYENPSAHAGELIADLYFQRAALAGSDASGAAVDRRRACLDHVLYYQPNHVEACWQRGEIALAAGELQVALSLWRRCVANATGPAAAKYELELSRVLEESANDVSGAIEQLNHLVSRTPSDMALRERLLALATRGQAWDIAAAQLRELAPRRSTKGERARDEHRLGQMHRDKLHDKLAARLAFDRARVSDPLNLDVVRDLAELLDGPAKAEVLGVAASDAYRAVVADPTAASAYERLAMIHGWQSDVDGRFMALAGVEAVGVPTPDQRLVLKNGRAQAPQLDWKRVGQQRVTPTIIAGLRPASTPGGNTSLLSGGACHELWRAIASTVTAAHGLEPSKFGFTRSDRIAQKKLGDKHQALAATLMFYGIDGADIYISETRAGVARTLSTDDGVLCFGADIASGATPAARYQLARNVALLAERVATIAELRESDLVGYVVASLRSVDAQVPAELAAIVRAEETVVAERARAMRKLARKDRAAVVTLAARASELAALPAYRHAALAMSHRAGLLWAGDIAVALEMLDVGRGARAIADNPIAQDLMMWSVSVDHRRARDELGLARGGGVQ